MATVPPNTVVPDPGENDISPSRSRGAEEAQTPRKRKWMPALPTMSGNKDRLSNNLEKCAESPRRPQDRSDLFGAEHMRAHRGFEPVCGQAWSANNGADSVHAPAEAAPSLAVSGAGGLGSSGGAAAAAAVGGGGGAVTSKGNTLNPSPVPSPCPSINSSQSPTLRKSGTALLFQQFKDKDRQTKPPSRIAVKCHWILQRTAVQVFMMTLTIAILFCGDIFSATLDVSSDKAYTVILWACLIFFSLEWGLNVISSPAQTPTYNLTLFFWLDLIATLSIALDILVIEANNLMENGPIARAARAARLGTRAGRSMRLLRLLRFLRLVRIVRMVKALLSFRDNKGKDRHNQHRHLDSVDIPDMVDSANTTRADTMGAQIGATTTRKVVIMTLMLLIVLPLLERSEEGHTCGAELSQMLTALWNSDSVGRDCNQMITEVEPWLNSGLLSFSRNSDSGLTVNGLIYIQVEGCQLYSDVSMMGSAPPDQATLGSQRRSSEIQVIPCDAVFADTDEDGVDDRSATYLLYDMREEERETSRLAVGFTVVVIVILLGFSLVFSQDAEVLASELVIPIGQLMEDMRRTSQLELDTVTPDDELLESNVYEVRRLQIAYQGLNGAVGSFVKFMPLEVVRHFLRIGTEATLEVNQRNVSIFFSDIVGFAGICDSSPPIEVLNMLSEYFERMVTLIVEEKGTMLEFIGDAILAIWNAPNNVKNHAVHAINSALRMNEELVKLRDKWEKENRPRIRIRVGIHSADVFVGNLGSRMRMKYGVLGDGVNLASRLEELNKRYNTEIVISEDVMAQVGVPEAFYMRPLDNVVVKGRKKPTAVYEVLDWRATASEKVKSISSQADQAWKSYMSRDFAQALVCLENITKLKELDHDPVGEVLAARCRNLLVRPPGDDWDGSEVLNQKTFGAEG